MPTELVDPPTPAGVRPFSLHVPPPQLLTSKEELAFARAAFARRPEDAAVRRGLVRLLLRLDHFDEGLALVEAHPGDELVDANLFASLLLNRSNPADTQRALPVAERAVALSDTPVARAAALSQLAKVHLRLGNNEQARVLLTEARALDPANEDAYKRMFRLLLEADNDPAAALAFVENSIEQGTVHARSLGSWVLALTKLGRFDEARRAEAADRFLARFDPATPEGWNSLAEFNAALADEALGHPDMRYNRYGTASTNTWRLDKPYLRRTKVFAQLQHLVQREVEAYVRSLAGKDHPFARAVPAEAQMGGWCVITEGDGYETYHVHPHGWLSGVYYIHVQDHIAQGSGAEGCLAFGMPDFLVGTEAAAAYGEQLVRPHSGLMMLFPSHVYHRTFPHRGPGRRICFAFDISPA